ncbi:conserved hypothetical protein [Hahella chejuensis KCTC 2396]|uniref:Uncharacterized protein n=1 Tax=Hahella chejuensis (strain KCTC 2396) TaxID=349521 RepID=Q2SGL2_HAHCH|nr:BREX-2 system phosphatase PglZ [Hahella chejuensis]ABC30212.1 conserved hypothetical protein [Hahella chejuensis KCTC 2396]
MNYSTKVELSKNEADLSKLPSPLLTQIQAVLRRAPNADRIAIFWTDTLVPTEYTGRLEDTSIKLVYCVSELAMREALVEHDGNNCLVLVAPFGVTDLAQDVLARLWRNEPQRISPWRTLEQLTRVQSIDPRLPKRYGKWMAEALLSRYDRYEKSVHFGEVLDQETAWQALAVGYLGFNQQHSDLSSLFRWSISNASKHQPSNALPAEMQESIADWLSITLNGLAPVVGQLIVRQPVEDLLAIGLVCSVIYHPDAVKEGALSYEQQFAANIKLKERQLNGIACNTDSLAKFGEKAALFVKDLIVSEPDGYQKVKNSITKAEQLLASVDASDGAICSNVLPAGFRLRLITFGKALEQAIKKGDTQPAQLAFRELELHVLGALPGQRDQIERAKMALRLVHWLLDSQETTQKALEKNTNCSQLLKRYMDHGGFVDWARTQIWFGDAEDALSQVYQRLAEKIGDGREAENFEFGTSLESIAKGDQLPSRLLYVEQALEKIVAPIAEQSPVLLLVLDGMSQAVYRELIEDFANHNWVELQREDIGESQSLVSALPSITQVSRYALLSGELGSGLAQEEKKNFTNHPLLKRIASTKFPPKLFHKQDLQQSGSGSLNSEVRALIAGTEHKILAAVINAVDDQLSSSSQVAFKWQLDSIRPLKQVLEAARESGRVVIVTSDHGHTLEHETTYYSSSTESGERYHSDTKAIREKEVITKGIRVVGKDNTAVVPWSEKVRYSKSKNMGYHGGASLQEASIPLGVFSNSGAENKLSGWKEVPLYRPDWWTLNTISVVSETPTPEIKQEEKKAETKTASKRKATEERIDDLFAEPEATKKITSEDWVEQLFDSAVYKDAQSRLGRMAISKSELKEFLTLLSANGGQIMQAVVVRELKKPELRMRGFLSAAQRILNVDGYPILKVERDSQTIMLDVRALKTQFEL